MKKTLAAILALVLTLSLCSLAWATQPVNVAKIGDTEYATLKEAYDAAADGAIITLLSDCSAERINLENKSITVVLDGHTLTSTSAYKVMFCAKNGHKITIDGTKAGSKLVGTLMITANTDGHIEINGGTYENDAYCPIYINGAVSTDNSTLTVNNAAITALQGASDQDNGLAMYLAGYSTSVLTNCTITAPTTGIEIRAGKLTLTNCNVTGGNGQIKVDANGNGATVENAAIAVSQHNTKKPIDVTINGGTFAATAALYQVNPQGIDADSQSKVSTVITSGTFNGEINKVEEANNTKLSISGGTFSENVKIDYLPEGAALAQIGEQEKYVVGADNIKAEAQSGNDVKVLHGDVAFTGVPSGTKITNQGGGNVTVNGGNRLEEGTTYTVPAKYYYYPSTSTTDSSTGKASPKTFDAGVGVYAVTAVLSLTGLAYTGKKKF